MKPGYDEYAFAGGGIIPAAMRIAAAIDRGRIGFNGENVVGIQTSSSGLIHSSDDPQNNPASIYVFGTENYDGLQRIYDVLGGSIVSWFAPYIAEATDGTETFRVGFESTFPCKFGGFSVTLDAASSTSENLEIVNHSAKGSAYDNLIWRKDMDGVQDDSYMFNPPIFLAPGDRLDLTWTNTEAIDWGISLYIRKLR